LYVAIAVPETFIEMTSSSSNGLGYRSSFDLKKIDSIIMEWFYGIKELFAPQQFSEVHQAHKFSVWTKFLEDTEESLWEN
jgi:hypothetical protein